MYQRWSPTRAPRLPAAVSVTTRPESVVLPPAAISNNRPGKGRPVASISVATANEHVQQDDVLAAREPVGGVGVHTFSMDTACNSG